MKCIFTVGAAAAILCAAAGAANAGPAAGTTYGYVEAHGGGSFSSADYTSYGAPIGSDSEAHPAVGGAARGSILLAPHFSIQGDVWADESALDSYHISPGVALHATFLPTARDQIGGLVSIGGQYSYDYDVGSLTRLYMTNVAVEWAHNGDKWRLYGQAGYASNINGTAFIQGWDPQSWQIPVSNPYAMVAGTYFFTPGVALSAKLGIDKFVTPGINWVVNDYGVDWGAKLEFQMPGQPVIGFISVNGRADWFDDHGPADDGFAGHGIQSAVLAGVKIPLTQGTLQDIYQHAGLADLNPTFGDLTY